MPIITTRRPLTESAEETAQIDDAALFDSNGLNLSARTVASFLRDVNFDDFFEDADLSQFVMLETACVKEVENGEWEECEETDEGAEPTTVEVLSGDIIAKFIDEDDLMGLFEHYLREEYPRETLGDRLALAQFDDLLIESPFKRGNFRDKGKFGGGGGHNERGRMMKAMLKKGAIRRVGKGKGYKGGDYKYGKGKEANVAKYKKMANNKVRAKQIAGPVKKYGGVEPTRKTKIIPAIYKNLHAKMPKKWIPPEKRIGGHKVKAGGKPYVFKKAAVSAEKKKGKLKEAVEQFRKQLESTVHDGTRIYEGAPNGRSVGPHLTGAALSGKARMPVLPAKLSA